MQGLGSAVSIEAQISNTNNSGTRSAGHSKADWYFYLPIASRQRATYPRFLFRRIMGRMKSTGMPLCRHDSSSALTKKKDMRWGRYFGKKGGGHLHGLVCKTQEKICICGQVARLEVFILGCDAVDLERDGEVVVLP